MILIADSGSTKSDWILTDGIVSQHFQTRGFNPFFHSEDLIAEELLKHKDLVGTSRQADGVIYYGAGCHDPELSAKVSRAIQRAFGTLSVQFDHDLNGAAYATCDGKPGIACILGTGSNSCYFDGERTHNGVPSLSYLLGDEGSGNYLGRKMLTAYLYNWLPPDLHAQLRDEYGLTKEIIFDNVYFQPNPNVYMASFTKLLSNYTEEPFVKRMITEGMERFFKAHVCCFDSHKEVPVHFIGSVAFYFQPLLKQVAQEMGIIVGTIVRRPIENLVKYHLARG